MMPERKGSEAPGEPGISATELALKLVQDAPEFFVFERVRLDLLHGVDHGAVGAAAERAADFLVRLGRELARQVHGDHARFGDVLRFLRTGEVVDLDSELLGDRLLNLLEL